MYKIKLYTTIGDMFLKYQSKKLPDWEFIACLNDKCEEFFINRNQILYYRILKDERKDS